MPDDTATATTTELVTDPEVKEATEGFGDSFEEFFKEKAADDRAKDEAATKQPTERKAAEKQDAPPAKSDKYESMKDLPERGSSKDWKELNQERFTLREEVKTLKDKLSKIEPEVSKFKAAATEYEPLKNRYAQVEQERNDLSDRLRLLDIERHPKFQAHFTEKQDALLTIAKGIVGESKAVQIEHLLRLPESDYKTQQLDLLMKELPESKKTKLGSALLQLDQIAYERENEIKKSKDSWNQVLEADKRDRENKLSQAKQRLEIELKGFSEAFPLLQEREGDTEWNQKVQERLNTIHTIYEKLVHPDPSKRLPNEDLAEIAIYASTHGDLLLQSIGLAGENKALKEELAKVKAGRPKMDSAHSEEQDAEQDDYKDIRPPSWEHFPTAPR